MRHAERLFIKANRADLAIGAYRERGAWDDAIRVAADYAPRRVLELENERRRTRESKSKASSAASREDREKTARRKVEALVEKASSLEASGDYAGAVDAYFEVHRKAFGASPSADEKATMIKAWRAAVKLAGERVPGKTRAVVSEAAYGFRKLGDAAAADDLLAVHGVSPAEARDSFASRSRRRGFRGGQEGRGVFAEADTLAVSENASSAASASSARADALRRAAHAARSGDGATGASTLAASRVARRWTPSSSACTRTVAASALAFRAGGGRRRRRGGGRRRRRGVPHETGGFDARHPRRARGRAARVPGSAGSRASDARLAHGDATQYAEASGMKSVAAKAATSAASGFAAPGGCRVFRAGALCRAAGDTNSAFVFLNRFLDIADAVDDAAEDGTDSVSPSPRNSSRKRRFEEFASPGQRRLRRDGRSPARASHPALGAYRGREVARGGEGLGADRLHGPRGDAAAPERACAKWGSTFAGALKCHRCGAESERCAVTGWPVPPGERVDAGGGRGAKRADWDAWANAVGTDPGTRRGKPRPSSAALIRSRFVRE